MKNLKSLFLIGVGIAIATSFPEQTSGLIEDAKMYDYAGGLEMLVQKGKDFIDFIAGLFGDTSVEAASN